LAKQQSTHLGASGSCLGLEGKGDRLKKRNIFGNAFTCTFVMRELLSVTFKLQAV